MTSPSVVQEVGASSSSASSLSALVAGATAGNALLVAVYRSSTGGASDIVTADDDVDLTAYTSLGVNYANSNRIVQWLYLPNITGGDTTITVEATDGTTSSTWANWGFRGVEVTGVGSSPTITYGENDTASGATQYHTPATGFSPAADTLVLALATKNAAVTSFTVGSSYTLMSENTSTPIYFLQRRAFATLSTNHRPEHTVDPVFRVGPASAIIIPAGAAPATADFPFRKYYQGV